MSGFRTTTAAALCLAALAVPAFAQAPDTLGKIKGSGAISLGNRESSVPFSYLDNEQKPIGFSIDLCKAVTDRIAQALSLPSLKVSYVAVNSANRIPLVQNGTVDLECGATANDLQRQKQVAFSVATFVSQFKFLTKAGTDIENIDQLKGKTVVVTQGSNTVAYLSKVNEERGLGLQILQGKDHAESFLMVQSGRASAFMEDDILLAGLRANARRPADFALSGLAMSENPYGLMFRRDDPAFKKLVDDTLSGMMKDGSFTKLYAAWFQAPIPPKGVSLEFPMSAKSKDRVDHPSDHAD